MLIEVAVDGGFQMRWIVRSERPTAAAIARPVAKAKGTDAKRASRDALYPGDFIPECRAKSSRNSERHQIGMAGEIIPECRATSVGIST